VRWLRHRARLPSVVGKLSRSREIEIELNRLWWTAGEGVHMYAEARLLNREVSRDQYHFELVVSFHLPTSTYL
jgi:hypothetical protein